MKRLILIVLAMCAPFAHAFTNNIYNVEAVNVADMDKVTPLPLPEGAADVVDLTRCAIKTPYVTNRIAYRTAFKVIIFDASKVGELECLLTEGWRMEYIVEGPQVIFILKRLD